jgi:hypothetical protein
LFLLPNAQFSLFARSPGPGSERSQEIPEVWSKLQACRQETRTRDKAQNITSLPILLPTFLQRGKRNLPPRCLKPSMYPGVSVAHGGGEGASSLMQATFTTTLPLPAPLNGCRTAGMQIHNGGGARGQLLTHGSMTPCRLTWIIAGPYRARLPDRVIRQV